VATDAKALAGPTRPLGSPEIPQFHLASVRAGDIYVPWLYGAARIHFADRKRKIDEARRVAFRVRLAADTRTVDWEAAEPLSVMPEDLQKEAARRGGYLPLPSGAMQVKVFTRWAKAFDRWLARTQRLEVPAAAGDVPAAEPTTIGPKRGGVSVELVAILWELT
jgi:hypothetical protein